jgi:hypothetical protein
VNYKGRTVYKELQKKTYSPLRLKQHTPSSEIKETLHTQPGVTYAQITKQNSYAPTNIHQEPQTNQPYQQTSSMQDLKNMLKRLFEQMGTMLNLLTTVLTKFKQWLNSYNSPFGTPEA